MAKTPSLLTTPFFLFYLKLLSMGQKTHPLGFRLGITQNHLSEWYAAQQYAQFIHEDHLIRMFIFKELTGASQRVLTSPKTKVNTDSGSAKPSKAAIAQDGPTADMTKRSEGQSKATASSGNVNGDAGLSKTLIYRYGDRIKVEVHVAQPKIATGEGGLRLKELTQGLSNVVTAIRKSAYLGQGYKMYRRLTPTKPGNDQAPGYNAGLEGSDHSNSDALIPDGHTISLTKTTADVSLNVIQIIDPRIDVNILAQRIAQQLERRIAYRRVMKQSIKDASEAGVEGIKIEISGRLNGAEIARSETIKNGTLPLHTLRARIDYCSHRAETIYGTLGIKVWIHKKAA
jgi:ribosomal protein S3